MSASKVPWDFWLIGVVSLLWNSFGAHDYFMTVILLGCLFFIWYARFGRKKAWLV